MARKKLKFNVTSNMFGHTISVTDTDGDVTVLGSDLNYDPTSRFDTKLKEGFLFRNPTPDPDQFENLWATIESLSGKFNVWLEQEVKKDQKTKTFAYALLADKSDATMFAFSHTEFQKWSKDLDKEAKKEANRKPLKARVTKDGRIKVRTTVTTLSDI